MDDYTIIIIGTLVGFLGLAALLLVPVYRFLKREEEASRDWTSARRERDAPERPIESPANGTPSPRP